MIVKNSILSVLTVTSLAVHSFNLCGQAVPIMEPSSLCVHTNEQVFLHGVSFTPGVTVQGYLISSHYRSPLWGAAADTNGEFAIDITFRGNIDMNGPRAVQEYYFVGGGTNVYFHVWYQTYNPTNDWHAIVTSINAYAVDYATNVLQVDVFATVSPAGNNYQVQMSDDLRGPWNFVGEVTTHENPYTNLYFSQQIPLRNKAFFRIANPFLPCPCGF